MPERPIVALEQGNGGPAERLLDVLVAVGGADADDGREQVERVLAEIYGLELIHLGPPESLPPETCHRPYIGLRAANGFVMCAWPPERLVDPATRVALHLVSRVGPRLRQRPGVRPGSGPLPGATGRLLGMSAPMCQLHDRIARVAQRSFSVLIEGESGVGKELVAREVHALSDRRRGPFVAVNCAAIVETLLEAELFGIEERTATGVRGRRGKFEVADGGTLFLDEVSDLSASAQAKLLRAIQDLSVERVGGHGSRQVDVRIIAATNRSLAGAVERGTFRQDLYYRLNAIEIRVPPLRARREDIPLLAAACLDRYRDGRTYRFSLPAADALLVYEWPGNVRELERAIERAVTLATCDVIDVADLPDAVTGTYREVMVVPLGDADDTMRAWGSRYARLVLERAHGNKREACRRLGISYHTLKAYLSYRGPRRASSRYPREEGRGVSTVHEAPPVSSSG
jgi:DNA-binding NtrC family response regulator